MEKETLRQAQYGNAIFQLKDIDGINLSNKEMKTKINRIYKKLNLQPTDYQITDVDGFYFQWQHEVEVKTADQSTFVFNGSTKELLKIQLSKAILQQKKEISVTKICWK
ncbi:hypothetical protein OE903_07680 [Bacillus sp. B6(2022)]|nr:hypothetical protein [Bacillus sp. B6(2022)]